MHPADPNFDTAPLEPLLEHADEHDLNAPAVDQSADGPLDDNSPAHQSGSQLPVSQLMPPPAATRLFSLRCSLCQGANLTGGLRNPYLGAGCGRKQIHSYVLAQARLRSIYANPPRICTRCFPPSR
jgi:hypothetical protein